MLYGITLIPRLIQQIGGLSAKGFDSAKGVVIQGTISRLQAGARNPSDPADQSLNRRKVRYQLIQG